MNIFVLDKNPLRAAQYHCDKHVSKMTLETAQMMSTVHHQYGTPDVPYRPTHKHHPCVVWAATNRSNFIWLATLGACLANEFWHRRGKRHKSSEVIQKLKAPPDQMPDGIMTDFALAMPDTYKTDDAVESYRRFYLGEKSRFAEWKWGRKSPLWWRKNQETNDIA